MGSTVLGLQGTKWKASLPIKYPGPVGISKEPHHKIGHKQSDPSNCDSTIWEKLVQNMFDILIHRAFPKPSEVQGTRHVFVQMTVSKDKQVTPIYSSS